MNIEVILFRTFIHVIIMMQKADPQPEEGVGILIMESSIKVIDAHWKSGKAWLLFAWWLILNVTKFGKKLFWELFVWLVPDDKVA